MKIDKTGKIDDGLNQTSVRDDNTQVLSDQKLTPPSDKKADQIMNAETLSNEDLDFIQTHGARAYAEMLQDKIVAEIRNKLIVLMGLSETPESEIPELLRQTIEGLISVEIQTRMQASTEMDQDAANDNSTYLKTMLLTQGNYGFFDGQPITTLAEFEKGVSHGTAHR